MYMYMYMYTLVCILFRMWQCKVHSQDQDLHHVTLYLALDRHLYTTQILKTSSSFATIHSQPFACPTLRCHFLFQQVIGHLFNVIHGTPDCVMRGVVWCLELLVSSFCCIQKEQSTH